LAGCGPSGPETYEVSGEVTFDGQPVAEGRIVFRDAGGSAASWAGEIEDGRYAFPATVGKKRVEITATRQVQTSQDSPSGQGAFTFESYIPAKYHSQSELTAEVTPEGPNEFNFPLEP
jgi:hypothetical protein